MQILKTMAQEIVMIKLMLIFFRQQKIGLQPMLILVVMEMKKILLAGVQVNELISGGNQSLSDNMFEQGDPLFIDATNNSLDLRIISFQVVAQQPLIKEMGH